MVTVILLRSIIVTVWMLFSWSAFAESTESEQVEESQIEEGFQEEEWQEEELSSPSEWIENLASPVTRWIEQKVQEPAAVQNTDNVPTIENLPDDVISPQEAIEDPFDIELGVHGISLEYGYKRGVFLPQVATQFNWNKEEFWSYLALEKAGVSPRKVFEKDPEMKLFRFSAQVFHENSC